MICPAATSEAKKVTAWAISSAVPVLRNGYNFFIEEGVADKKIKEVEVMKGRVESDLIKLIEDSSLKYGGITLKKLSAELDYPPSIIRPIIKVTIKIPINPI